MAEAIKMGDAIDAGSGEYRQYSCLFCGHIYDEEEGDPDSGIAPGTRWDDITDDWCCPMCSAGKADFELI
jgi:rubredoxin---NAD+ reductase